MAFCVEDIELGDDTSLLAELVACWRASVEATHTFLTPDDIERIAGYVPGAIVCRVQLRPSRTSPFAGMKATRSQALSVSMAL